MFQQRLGSGNRVLSCHCWSVRPECAGRIPLEVRSNSFAKLGCGNTDMIAAVGIRSSRSRPGLLDFIGRQLIRNYFRIGCSRSRLQERGEHMRFRNDASYLFLPLR